MHHLSCLISRFLQMLGKWSFSNGCWDINKTVWGKFQNFGFYLKFGIYPNLKDDRYTFFRRIYRKDNKGNKNDAFQHFENSP